MKPRDPHSWADAVTRIAGAIGWQEAAYAVRKSEATVRAWSDADTGKRPSLDQALALSAAYAATGADDAPFVDAFEFQIDARVDARDPCRRALTADVALVAREVGEAIAAALHCSTPGSSPLDEHQALAHAREAEQAVDRLVHRLAAILAASTGLPAEKSGGAQK